MNKVVIIDSGFFTHKSIFSWGAEKKRLLKRGSDKDPIVSSYTYFNMCLSTLKKIGIDKNDLIIIAKDGRNSWRKAFDVNYKGQRKELRDSHEEIDWNKQYKIINKLEEKINESTNWHVLFFNYILDFADLCCTKDGQDFEIENYNLGYNTKYSLEADDIMAVAPLYFKNKEIILVATDEDLDQLMYFDNVRIFNPNLKSPTNKSKKGFYKIVDDPLKVLNKKIRLGDRSDNILVPKNETKKQQDIRRLIVSLINLPEFVIEPILNELQKLPQKEINYEKLPFQSSLAKKFDTIYNSKNVVTFEESLKRHNKKEEMRKKKQQKKHKEK